MPRTMDRRRFIAASAAGSALLAVPGAHAAAAPALQAAKIEGPIPVTAASGEPYRGANEQPVAGPGLPIPDLVPYDYVEEEYFVSGTVAGGAWKTSMLVRKPRDPKKFSGLVAVETIHNAGAIPLWGQKKTWLTGGHGWVGVGSQLIAFRDHIVKSNPKRYAGLALPIAPADPSQAGAPGGMGGGMTGGAQDTISQDIMTQVGLLLKANLPKGPFARMRVTKLAMGGSSQTGGTTLRYIQQSHDKARLANGKPVYDGYLPSMAFTTTPLPATDAVVVHAVTEGDLMNALQGKRTIGYKPDGDGADKYRHLQITGMSHVGTRGVTDPLQVFSTLANGVRPGEKLSQFPAGEMMTPVSAGFVAWLMNGTPPPRAPLIEVANGEIVRDALGNAKGGIRSPYVDIATVRYIAAAPMAPGENPFRRLIGLEEPISPEKLRQLYGTRAAYLAKFDQQIDAMVRARFLMADDAAKLKEQEARRPLF